LDIAHANPSPPRHLVAKRERRLDASLLFCFRFWTRSPLRPSRQQLQELADNLAGTITNNTFARASDIYHLPEISKKISLPSINLTNQYIHISESKKVQYYHI